MADCCSCKGDEGEDEARGAHSPGVGLLQLLCVTHAWDRIGFLPQGWMRDSWSTQSANWRGNAWMNVFLELRRLWISDDYLSSRRSRLTPITIRRGTAGYQAGVVLQTVSKDNIMKLNIIIATCLLYMIYLFTALCCKSDLTLRLFSLLTSWEREWDTWEMEVWQGVSVSRVTEWDWSLRVRCIVGREGGCVSQSSCAIQISSWVHTHEDRASHTHSTWIWLHHLFSIVVFTLIDLQEYCNQKPVRTDNVLSSLHCVIRINAFLNLILKKESYFLSLPRGLV